MKHAPNQFWYRLNVSWPFDDRKKSHSLTLLELEIVLGNKFLKSYKMLFH